MKVLKLTPSFKDYIWGGTRLSSEWGKKSPYEKTAESWEVSCHQNGPSYLITGETLKEYLAAHPEALGTKNQGEFPILIKLIDAQENLSVQVHPDDDFASREEGETGKTEFWYVADASPGAFIYYGVEKEVSREEFSRRIEDGTLEEVLRRMDVKKGDGFFIPAGTVHAIGKGCLIAEIQQNSDVTYRVYDYNRIGADGKPRELHIEKAKAVSSLTPIMKEELPDGLLAKTTTFRVRKKDVRGDESFHVEKDSFVAVLCVEGEGTLSGEEIKKGDAFFIPAGAETIPVIGEMTLLLSEGEKIDMENML